MKKKYFLLIQFLIFILFTLLVNLGIGIASRNAVPRQLMRKMNMAAKDGSWYLGNSLIHNGIVPELLDFDSEVINAGLNSSTAAEHCLLWRIAATKKPKRVVYGYFDTMLTDPLGLGWYDLVGNRAMSYYVPSETIHEIYGSSSVLATVISYFPALVERWNIWLKVEKMRRSVGEIGLPPVVNNEFGRVSDSLDLLEDQKQFRKRNLRPVLLNKPMQYLFRELKKSGTESWVILMPATSTHCRDYYGLPEYEAYKKDLFNMLTQEGIHCVDASRWIPDSEFSDAIHLNNRGARQFSKRLAQVLQKLQ